jgi:hypothetical protein
MIINWQDAEKRIGGARRAFMRVAAEQREFLDRIAAARDKLAWTNDVRATPSFWACCDLMGVEPADERRGLLSLVGSDMGKIIEGRYGFRCPVCARVKEPR